MELLGWFWSFGEDLIEEIVVQKLAESAFVLRGVVVVVTVVVGVTARRFVGS